MPDEPKDIVERLRGPHSGFVPQLFYEAADEIERLRGCVRIAEAHSLANNLCPDHRDKQKGKPCLACEIERLRSEVAVARVDAKNVMRRVDFDGQTVFGTYYTDEPLDPPGFEGGFAENH